MSLPLLYLFLRLPSVGLPGMPFPPLTIAVPLQSIAQNELPLTLLAAFLSPPMTVMSIYSSLFILAIFIIFLCDLALLPL